MAPRQGYIYLRNLDIMMFGKVIDDDGRDAFRIDNNGTRYRYDFRQDAENLLQSPMGGYDRNNVQRIELVQNPNAVVNIRQNVEYIQLFVRSTDIYNCQIGMLQPQVQDCLRWLAQDDGPSKIRINCHGDLRGNLTMGNSKIKKIDGNGNIMKIHGQDVTEPVHENIITGTVLADWLFRHGLTGPKALLIDARQLGKWQSKSHVIGCSACSLPFLYNQTKKHCRACGEVVHDTCLQQKHILGALKPNALGRVFSTNDRRSEICIDYACRRCVQRFGNPSFKLTAQYRNSEETLETRRLYKGVINIGLWCCYGGVHGGNKISLKISGRNKPHEESVANQLAKRLHDRRIEGIEITGRTDYTWQYEVTNPDGSGDKYYRLGQVKKNIFGRPVASQQEHKTAAQTRIRKRRTFS